MACEIEADDFCVLKIAEDGNLIAQRLCLDNPVEADDFGAIIRDIKGNLIFLPYCE